MMIVRRAKRIHGSLTMPGDKSISHRAAMIAALAEGTSRISNFATGADCASTLSCLQQLGLRIERLNSEIVIEGAGLHGLRRPNEVLDCGNSGTTMRLLAGVLAGQSFTSILNGDESLRGRPMQRVIEPLRLMGAKISSNNGHPPLTVEGTDLLRAISYQLPVASAQVKSSILLAGLGARGQTKVIEAQPTRDHSERMLRFFGVNVEDGFVESENRTEHFATINSVTRIAAQDVSVPGDISSAAYFVAAAALVRGAALQITNVGLNPTRSEFLKQLESLGFGIRITAHVVEGNEPRGVIDIAWREPEGRLIRTPLRFDGPSIAKLIDELPLLAVVGSQLPGGIEIRDASELRVKESDRITATARNLRNMGVDVEEFDDGLRVKGPARLQGTTIDSHGDHRIAMAFAIAGLMAEGETEITDADCVAVSFPEFFGLLHSVVE
jgi:3-phosphoshikimate 1-carboxyvinyltransferase